MTIPDHLVLDASMRSAFVALALAWRLITAWTWTALLMTWIRWLMRNLVSVQSRIETWPTCCDTSLGALKQARS
ncbi:hypothetical protein AB2C47_32960 [Pseudomonas aeruginosa]